MSAGLALQVAQELTTGNALAAHKRDELGITAETTANPIQAGLVSAATFATGAALPLAVAALLPQARLLVGVSVATIVALVALGAIGARIGGAPIWRGAARVTVWGALAMLATALVGWAFGTVAS